MSCILSSVGKHLYHLSQVTHALQCGNCCKQLSKPQRSEASVKYYINLTISSPGNFQNVVYITSAPFWSEILGHKLGPKFQQPSHGPSEALCSKQWKVE